jgi:hypothetical protein
VTDESARGGEGERRDTALSHDLVRVRWGSARARIHVRILYRLPETVVHGVLCGTRCAARPAHLTPHLKRHRPLSVAQTDTGFTVTFINKKTSIHIDIARFGKPTLSSKAQFHTNRETYNPLDQWCMTRPRAAS